MKKTLLTSALLVSSLIATPVLANKNYVAKPEQSKWTMLENSPLECRLSHNIPNYGNAEFSSYANKKMNLDFELKMNRPMGETRSVNLVSMPPRWTPGEAADSMTNLKFFKQFDGYVGGTTAWSMLAELENGRFPTFTYADWQSPKQLIEVALSPVVFQKTYNVFSMCIANLLPYSFEDISFTILHFDKNSDELNKASKKRLSQIADFIRYTKDVDLVLVATYTDSSGGKNVNQQVSERRAVKLQNYFESIGLPADRIRVQSYGERRPIADNATPIGKNKNRRVVISLGRTII